MADEDERRFYIGDEVKLRGGFGIPEMRQEVLVAVGLVGDVADRQGGQTLTVLYRSHGFCAANLPASSFDLVRRGPNRRPDMPTSRRLGLPTIGG